MPSMHAVYASRVRCCTVQAKKVGFDVARVVLCYTYCTPQFNSKICCLNRQVARFASHILHFIFAWEKIVSCKLGCIVRMLKLGSHCKLPVNPWGKFNRPMCPFPIFSFRSGSYLVDKRTAVQSAQDSQIDASKSKCNVGGQLVGFKE